MTRKITFVINIVFICFISLRAFAQATPPTIEWQRTIGGSGDDRLMTIQQTSDGGYIAAGHSNSGISGEKTEVCRGDRDFWIIKLDVRGNIMWQKTYGGDKMDIPHVINQTPDGGYIVGGCSESSASGDKTGANRGVVGSSSWGRDYWILKLDATGAIQWQQTYGVYGMDMANSILLRKNGGYIIGGLSEMFTTPSGYPAPDRTTANYSFNDYWMLKLDQSGNIQFQQSNGGDRHDDPHCTIATMEGGYVSSGYTASVAGTGNKTSTHYGAYDNWVVKMDSNFAMQWQIDLGGTQDDVGIGADNTLDASGDNGILQMQDSGYFVGNTSKSGISGNKSTASYGGWDWWVVELTKTGGISRQMELGGSGDDIISNVLETADTGYLVAGTSNSGVSGNKTEPSRGSNDYWLVKMDKNRAIQWQLAFGGNDDDHMTKMRRTADGGYILGGFSRSIISGEKIENSRGDYDFWIIKLGKCDTIMYDTAFICKGDTYTRPSGIVVSQPGLYVDTLHSTLYCDTVMMTTLYFLSDTSHLRTNHILGKDTSLCAGEQLLLNATFAGAQGYIWNTGATNTIITVTQTDDYWVHVTQANGCITKDTIRVTFEPLPMIDLDDIKICESDVPSVVRSPQPIGYTYLWSTGLSDSVIYIANSGKYWLQVMNGRCQSSDTFNVNVVVEPEVNIGPDTIICVQIPVRIGTEIPNVTYLWNTGETTSYIYVDSTTDYVLRVNTEGCLLSDTVHITAMPAPAVNLGDTRDICDDETIPLDATSPDGIKYQWNTGATTPVYNAASVGLYWVQVTSEYGCVSVDSILLKYFAKPTVILPHDTVVCEETPLLLMPVYSINEESLLWSTGSTDRQINITQGGAYYLYATNKCGTRGDTINVKQIFCDIWLPNAFTPDGDGLNDILRVLGNIGRLQDFSFSIYNRWGEKIFITNDKYSGWNGTYKGEPASLGTYVYMLQYSRDGVPVFQKGNVTLMR